MKKYKISILLVFTLVIQMIFTTCYAISPSSNVIYNGIDVSEYQGNINFESVRNAGIDIVYIRSSEGTNFVDP